MNDRAGTPNRAPRIVVSSRVVSTINAEVLRFRERETGGILIGEKLQDAEDGQETIVVYAATEAGPEADRRRLTFEYDLEFVQARLDNFKRGLPTADYVGEWHRHLASFSSPSHGDLEHALEILADPDYGLDELVVPIAVRSWGRTQINVFYLARGYKDFRKAKWEVVPLGEEALRNRVLGIAPAVEEEPEAEEETETEAETTESDETVAPEPVEPRPPERDAVTMEEPSPSARDKSQPEAGKPAEPPAPAPEPEPVQWYETPAGRRRREFEEQQLRRAQAELTTHTHRDGSLWFVITPAGREGQIKIHVTCPEDYPESRPTVTVEESGEQKEFESALVARWDRNTILSDIIRELLQSVAPPAQWHETPEGVVRLQREIERIQQLRMPVRKEALDDGRLCLVVDHGASEPGQEILLIFPANYPAEPPEIRIRKGKWQIPHRGEVPFEWGTNRCSADLLLYL